MKYCSNCGNEVKENQDFCLNCGVKLSKKSDAVDNGGFGWGLLGFLVPIAGLVLFLMWNDERPKTAKALIKGAISSFIFGIVIVIIYVIIFLLFISNYY